MKNTIIKLSCIILVMIMIQLAFPLRAFGQSGVPSNSGIDGALCGITYTVMYVDAINDLSTVTPNSNGETVNGNLGVDIFGLPNSLVTVEFSMPTSLLGSSGIHVAPISFPGSGPGSGMRIETGGFFNPNVTNSFNLGGGGTCGLRLGYVVTVPQNNGETFTGQVTITINNSIIVTDSITVHATGAGCPSDCFGNIVTNGTFTQGVVIGHMPSGKVAHWSSPYTDYPSPDVSNAMACNDSGSVAMWGNKSVGEAIQETLSIPIVKGYTYRARLCYRWINDTTKMDYIQFKLRASKITLTGRTGGTVIGITPTTYNTYWTTVTLPDWIADSNYSILTIGPETNSSANAGDSTAYGSVDDICIQIVDSLSGSLCGLKFDDLNCDGVRDPGESGLPGWTINMTGTASGTTITDSGGFFCFDSLRGGQYMVSEVLPPNWIQTCPPNGYYSVTLPPNGQITNLYFGNCPGTKTQEHCSDFNDSTLQGWTYSNLYVSIQYGGPAGGSDKYIHCFDAPNASALYASNAYQGNWLPLIAHGCAVFYYDYIILNDGTSGSSPDYTPGFYLSGGGFQARYNANFQVSDPFGAHPGWHRVYAPIKTGSTPPHGWKMTVGTDANWNALLANVTSVQFGFDVVSNQDEEFGFDNVCLIDSICSSISGVKFSDLDCDSIRDPGEPGIANWTIYLNGDTTLTATTGPNGVYTFSGLPVGQYNVSEEIRPGWIPSCPASGSYTVTLLINDQRTNLDFGNCPATDCPRNIVTNGNFTAGLVAGAMTTGKVSNWSHAYTDYTTPDVSVSMGCTDTGFVRMWGNKAVGEAIQQTLATPILQGKIYRTTICIRWLNDPKKLKYIRFKLRASNTPLTGRSGGTVIGITPDDSDSWRTYLLPLWTADNNYSILTIGPENNSSANDGAQTSYGAIDDVCIQLVDSVTGSISGVKFLDLDSNCAQSAGEPGIAQWRIKLTGPSGPFSTVRFTTTVANGSYIFNNLPGGTYKLEEVPQVNWVQTCPVNPNYYTVTITSHGAATGYKFGNIQIINKKDLWVDVGATRARPGFPKMFYVSCGNKGTVAIASVKVTLQLPDKKKYIHFVTANYSGICNSSNLVTWKFASMAPGAQYGLWVRATVLQGAPLGTWMTSNAAIVPTAGDVNIYDNYDVESEQIRGSFDPNEIAVVPVGVGPHGAIHRTDTLAYTIHFQNTGTDTAFNIVVHDQIDPNLDLTTLIPGASSAPYILSIVDPSELVFTFNNILLPDSGVDKNLSNGFVKFRVRPNSDAPIGVDIPNNASIYFDYNAPVLTNTVSNRIGDTTSYVTFTPLDFGLAQNEKKVVGKPVVRGKGMPNALNVMDEAMKLGVFPGNPLGDSLSGGIVVGKSFLKHDRHGKLIIDTDSAKKYGWVRLGKWDAKKHIGSGYQDVYKSLYKKGKAGPIIHSGTPKRYLFNKQKTSLPPGDKNSNELFGELLALKINMLASLTNTMPSGFGELQYTADSIGSSLNGFLIREIAAKADSALTYPGYSSSYYATFDSVIKRINRAFEGQFDTVSFITGNKLQITGMISLGDIPFLLPSAAPSPKMVIDQTMVEQVPTEFALYQNYPNPFNPSTNIRFDLREQAYVTLKVYNILGQAVATLFDHELLDAQSHETTFNGNNFPSGVYFYRLVATKVEDGTTSQAFVSSKKMLLIK